MYEMATCPSYSVLLPASRPAPNAVAKRIITTMTGDEFSGAAAGWKRPDWSVHRKFLTAQHPEGVVGECIASVGCFFSLLQGTQP